MSEQHLLLAGSLLIGLTLGIIGMLVFNKVRGGSISPGTLKQEMEDYQGQVEAHFEQTSQKFQQMAAQYQDLYQHLAVGATSLCRPENISPGLTDQSDPLSKSKLIEQETLAEQASDDSEQVKSDGKQANSDVEQKLKNAENEPSSAEVSNDDDKIDTQPSTEPSTESVKSEANKEK